MMNNDVETEIKEAINKTKENLKGLTEERTCMIYSSYIYNNLKNKHITCRIIDTLEDLNMDYQHRFVIVPKNEKEQYIIDLTYKQIKEDKRFKDIYEKGYQLLSLPIYLEYLSNIKNTNTIKKRKK